MNLWYNNKNAPAFEAMKSKSVLHPFLVKDHEGLTINPYQGCHHRCGYCYATYEWSPEFYDKIYAKSNSPQILERQLKSWKSNKTIKPVMISSATDASQPAELKFELTRKCVEILQKYNFPYYVFTKSTIIKRDLEIHKQYKDNCFIVWSITTCDEKIRRIVEPGTPPASSMFEIIKRFTDADIRCGINIDPIIPLITDSPNDIKYIIDNCRKAGVEYVFGAILRLRADIWERIKIILKLFDIRDGIKDYNRIFQFTEPIIPGRNIAANTSYSNMILGDVKEQVLNRNMNFEIPDLIGTRCIESKEVSNNTNQLTLMNYM
jgi:DNA repair photolyase